MLRCVCHWGIYGIYDLSLFASHSTFHNTHEKAPKFELQQQRKVHFRFISTRNEVETLLSNCL